MQSMQDSFDYSAVESKVHVLDNELAACNSRLDEIQSILSTLNRNPSAPTQSSVKEIDNQILQLNTKLSQLSNDSEEYQSLQSSLDYLNFHRHQCEYTDNSEDHINSLYDEQYNLNMKMNSIHESILQYQDMYNHHYAFQLIRDKLQDSTIRLEDIISKRITCDPSQLNKLFEQQYTSEEIEEMFRICMFIDDLSTVITLYGLQEDLDPAMAFLHTLLEAMTREISSNMFNSYSLLYNHGSYLRFIEKKTHTSIFVSEKMNSISITGTEANLQTAKLELNSFFSNGTFLTIDQSIYLHFMANQQYEFLKLQKMCPGGLYLSRNNDVFTLFVFGFKPEVEQTMALINQYIAQVAIVTDTVSIGSRIVMNYLANKNGMFMKKIENQTMTSITVSNDDQSILTIRGTQENVAYAKRLLVKEIERAKKEYRLIQLDQTLIQIVLTDYLATMNAIKKKYFVNYIADKQTNSLLITGSEKNVMNAVEEINTMLSSIHTCTYSINTHLVGRFIGEKGEHVKVLNKKTGAFFSLSKDGVITIYGKDEQIEQAKQLITEWLAVNVCVQVNDDPIIIGFALNTKENPLIRQIANRFNVDVRVYDPSVICVTGLPADVDKAVNEIKNVLDQFKQNNIIIRTDSVLLANCYALRHIELKKLISSYPSLKIISSSNGGFIRISGLQEEREKACQLILERIEKYSKSVFFTLPYPSNFYQTPLVTKQQLISQIENQFNVTIHIKNNPTIFDVFGLIEDIQASIQFFFDSIFENHFTSKDYSLPYQQYQLLYMYFASIQKFLCSHSDCYLPPLTHSTNFYQIYEMEASMFKKETPGIIQISLKPQLQVYSTNNKEKDSQVGTDTIYPLTEESVMYSYLESLLQSKSIPSLLNVNNVQDHKELNQYNKLSLLESNKECHILLFGNAKQLDAGYDLLVSILTNINIESYSYPHEYIAYLNGLNLLEKKDFTFSEWGYVQIHLDENIVDFIGSLTSIQFYYKYIFTQLCKAFPSNFYIYYMDLRLLYGWKYDPCVFADDIDVNCVISLSSLFIFDPNGHISEIKARIQSHMVFLEDSNSIVLYPEQHFSSYLEQSSSLTYILENSNCVTEFLYASNSIFIHGTPQKINALHHALDQDYQNYLSQNHIPYSNENFLYYTDMVEEKKPYFDPPFHRSFDMVFPNTSSHYESNSFDFNSDYYYNPSMQRPYHKSTSFSLPIDKGRSQENSFASPSYFDGNLSSFDSYHPFHKDLASCPPTNFASTGSSSFDCLPLPDMSHSFSGQSSFPPLYHPKTSSVLSTPNVGSSYQTPPPPPKSVKSSPYYYGTPALLPRSRRVNPYQESAHSFSFAADRSYSFTPSRKNPSLSTLPQSISELYDFDPSAIDEPSASYVI